MNGGAAPTDLINDTEFITDLARYGEGVLTEAQVKGKYRRFDDEAWVGGLNVVAAPLLAPCSGTV